MSAPRHPLLSLTPAARRELARTLIRGLHAHHAVERTARRRAGLVGAAVVGGVGAGLGVAWAGLAGGALAPFAAAYAAAVALQAVAGGRIARDVERERGGAGPATPPPGWVRGAMTLVRAPHDLARAIRGEVAPERVSPDRLVLAAGLLTAVRHPLSSSLLRRLVARAYPLAEVDRAIALLVRMGYVAYAPAAPGVLVPTATGRAILKALGVPGPEARPRRDPEIPPHLVPLFAALDVRPRRARAMPEAAEAPAPELPRSPTPAPAGHPPPSGGGRSTPGTDSPSPPPRGGEGPARAEAGEAPAPVVELPRPRPPAPEAPAPPAPVPAAPAAPRRLPGPALAAAGFLLLLGLLVWLFPPTTRSGPRWHVAVSADLMPHSRGTALQFNGRGFLLSSFGGDLFLSIPERLDYKRPLSFQGYDMAADCGLVERDVRTARLAPLGRFLWAEMGGDGEPGGRERCLVDLETRTVTHDLAARQPAYGLPHVVGWAGPQTLLMATKPPPSRAGRWWAVDVVSHAAAPVDLPTHEALLPLATDGGPALLAGLDDRGDGAWDLTTYWLGDRRTFQKVRTIRATLPPDRKDGRPHVAALSPEKRFLLLALRGPGASVPAPTGTLAVVSLDDGAVTAITATPAPLVGEPVFWGPEVRAGRYRFYFNGVGPDGVVPWAGEMVASGDR